MQTCPRGFPVPARAVILYLASGLLLLFAQPGHVRAQVRFSVQEFNSSKTKHLGATIKVEGRVLLYGGTSFRLRNSDVLFKTETPITQRLRSQNLEVTGHVTVEQNRFVFIVSEYHESPSDAEEFQSRRRAIRDHSAVAWYALGEWARNRGKFYNDAALLEQADLANRRGIEIERELAVRDRVPKLMTLGERAKELDLPESVRRGLVHEACHLLWKEQQAARGWQLERLAVTLKEKLPGCETPPTGEPQKFLEQYVRDPLKVYQSASEADQRAAHRWLYADVQRRILLSQLQPDGRNGFEVARLIEAQLPEHASVAEELRNRVLAARAREVNENTTRAQVLELAGTYRARQQPQAAQDVLETWLTYRRRKLPADDIEGTLQLAEEYRTLVNHPETADQLLIAAAARHPEASELLERLQQAGYRLTPSGWKSARELAQQPEDRQLKALREGRIEPGMTAAMVRRSLGEPHSFSRSATAGQICEVWNYGQAGMSQLRVQLARRSHQPELKVISIHQVAGRGT